MTQKDNFDNVTEKGPEYVDFWVDTAIIMVSENWFRHFQGTFDEYLGR